MSEIPAPLDARFSPKLVLDRMPEEHLERWNEKKDDLITKALEAYKKAVSWRGFHVGCSMLSYNKLTQEYSTYAGSNFKPSKDVETICAEKATLDLVKQDEDTEIIGIVVISTKTQPDIQNAINSDILYPCNKCRLMFKRDHRVKPGTRILLIKANEESELFEKTEEMNCAELAAGIREGNIGSKKLPK